MEAFDSKLIIDLECLIRERTILGVAPQGKQFADLDRWAREFPQYQEIITEWERKTLNFLDRDTVQELSLLCIEKGMWVEAFLIVMIWGYSGDARGPARVSAIVLQPELPLHLKVAHDYLLKGDIFNAYDSLVVRGPKFLSTSFGTKILFFFSPNNSTKRPLIFDRRIFVILEKLGIFVAKSPVLNTNQYMEFLVQAEKLATQFQISVSEIEEYLFILSGITVGNYSWMRKVDARYLEPSQLEELSHLFATTIAGYLQNPEILINGNGGGQYGGFVVTGLNKGNKFEIHVAAHGRVLLVKPTIAWNEWSAILERGISQSVRDLLG